MTRRLIKRVVGVKKESRHIIRQLSASAPRAIGGAERFHHDDGLSRAVIESSSRMH